MPVTNFARISTFADACGATIPSSLSAVFQKLEDDPASIRSVATELAAAQCAELLAAGVDGLHFYTLNRGDLTTAICARIGIPARRLDRVNASQHGDYRRYYDPALVAAVAARYRRDLDLFGYDFEGPR